MRIAEACFGQLPKQIARARCQVSDLHIDLLRVCDAIGPASVRLQAAGPQRGREGSEEKLEKGKAIKTIMAQGERSEPIFLDDF